jgi:response regulator RpfG family c-di-GMP phosphodiesterase
MRAERGKHFDPRLVDLFFEDVDQLTEIRQRHSPPLITQDPPAVIA